MICKNCGRTVLENAEVCHFCGANLKSIQEQLQNQNVEQSQQTAAQPEQPMIKKVLIITKMVKSQINQKEVY